MPRGKKPKVDPAIIIREYLHGLGPYAVGQKLGISWTLVYKYLKRANIPLRGRQGPGCGPLNRNWTGGRSHDKWGYIRINVGRNQRRLEHRVVMEKVLGRPLADTEYVHHINGRRDDNRPENLVVTHPSKHEKATLVKALQRRICFLESIIKEHNIVIP